MTKTPKNHGTAWSAEDLAKLSKLAKGNTPTGLIAHAMGRTESSVRAKA